MEEIKKIEVEGKQYNIADLINRAALGGNVQSIEWSYSNNINNYLDGGLYHIKGERTGETDNLPILNVGSGHTIDGMLYVLDSSISESEVCVTQVLMLSNRVGGDGYIFIRTGNATSKDDLLNGNGWGTWAKQQGLFEKNQIDDATEIDGYTTNGMYSGVVANEGRVGSLKITQGSTILLITINGYAAVPNDAIPAQCTQLLYVLPLGYDATQGTPSLQKAHLYLRTGIWATNAFSWADWTQIDGGSGGGSAEDVFNGEAVESLNDTDVFAVKSGEEIHTVSVKDMKNVFGSQGGGTSGGSVEIVNDFTIGGANKALSAEMGKVLKEEVGDLEGNTKLTALDLMPVVYDGTKMVASSSFKTWVFPLVKDVSYEVGLKPNYILSLRTSPVYPSLGTVAEMPYISTTSFVATEDMKYLVISVDISKYNNEDYEIVREGYGIKQTAAENVKKIESNSQSIHEIKKIVSGFNGDLGTQTHKSKKTRISVWVSDTPNINKYLIKIECENPPVAKFSIYKATSSNSGLVAIVNNCVFGEYYEIQKDEEKPILYIYYSGGTDGDVEERSYTISFKTNDNIIQKVQDLEIGFELLKSTSEWGSKTIVCFGDSITEFKDESGKRYSDYIAEITGANVINVGVGGTQFRQRTQPLTTPTSDNEAYAALDIINMVKAACEQNFEKQINAASHLKSIDNNIAIVESFQSIDWSSVSAVTIFAGTNDWNNAPSSWGESGSTDVNTTFGAINEIVRLILTTYPHVCIYWFTPIVRWLKNDNDERTDETWSDNVKKNDKTLKEFSAAVAEEVSKHHLPICDMYNTLGWNQYNFSQYFKDTDGVHPTKGRGMEYIGRKIVAFINANKTF